MLLRMYVPPQSSMCLTAVTFSSLKTNTDSEQVVFLNNMFASCTHSWIILAGLGSRVLLSCTTESSSAGTYPVFPSEKPGNYIVSGMLLSVLILECPSTKMLSCVPCSPFLLSHHRVLTPSASFYSLAQADSVTQQKAGAAVSHKCRLGSHFQPGLETTVINYCYSCCFLCSKTCFFTSKRLTRSLRDATWLSLYHQGVCVSQDSKGTLTAFLPDFCTSA